MEDKEVVPINILGKSTFWANWVVLGGTTCKSMRYVHIDG
jgi:hypothetical protein